MMSSAIANRNIAEDDLPKYSVEDWAQWEGKWELLLKGRNITYDFNFGECKVTVDFGRIWGK